MFYTFGKRNSKKILTSRKNNVTIFEYGGKRPLFLALAKKARAKDQKEV